ncbi:MAG TPA: hypothetical protein ENJ82_09000 [Bacteroidetes bacterium]|nr:hypothetical protein [Bacteroidota bacterium]
MKTMFVINPVSGKGKGRKPYKIIQHIRSEYKKAGKSFEIRIWDRPDRIGEIIQEAIDGDFIAVVAAGGDGTINEIGKRLIGTGVALGVIPMGSGNGFARHLGYSRSYKRAISQILGAELVNVDSGDFGGVPFINNAGIGIDAEVIERFSRSKSRGMHTYVRLASRAILNFKTFDCTLVVDGKREYKWDRLLLIDIANGTQWGGGAEVSPLSDIQDGWLEAVVLEKTSIIKVPRLVRLLFQGKLYRHPNIKIVRGKTFEIIRGSSGNAHVDGETVVLGSTIHATIKESSVMLLVPDKMEAV